MTLILKKIPAWLAGIFLIRERPFFLVSLLKNAKPIGSIKIKNINDNPASPGTMKSNASKNSPTRGMFNENAELKRTVDTVTIKNSKIVLMFILLPFKKITATIFNNIVAILLFTEVYDSRYYAQIISSKWHLAALKDCDDRAYSIWRGDTSITIASKDAAASLASS